MSIPASSSPVSLHTHVAAQFPLHICRVSEPCVSPFACWPCIAHRVGPHHAACYSLGVQHAPQTLGSSRATLAFLLPLLPRLISTLTSPRATWRHPSGDGLMSLARGSEVPRDIMRCHLSGREVVRSLAQVPRAVVALGRWARVPRARYSHLSSHGFMSLARYGEIPRAITHRTSHVCSWVVTPRAHG